MAEWSGRRHAHGGHGLLLGDGRLPLLVGPVATDGARTEPFPIHGAEGFLSLLAITERNKSVATRTPRLHVPHYAGFRHRPEGREGLQKDLIVNFVTQITDKDMEMVGGILLGLVV